MKRALRRASEEPGAAVERDVGGQWTVVEQRLQAVLLSGGRERRAGDAGTERRDVLDPRRLELEHVVRPDALVAAGADDVEQPARRQVLGGPAQVAARPAQHHLVLGSGEDGAQLVVLPGLRVGGQRQHAAGAHPLPVGQEHVVRRAGGEGALGHPQHDHDVEVLAQREAHGAHEHAVAQATDPPEVGVELQLQRAAEALHGRLGIDGVEAAHPVERTEHLVGRRPLRLRPRRPGAVAAEEAVDEFVPERGEPRPRGRRGGQPRPEVEDEGPEVLGLAGATPRALGGRRGRLVGHGDRRVGGAAQAGGQRSQPLVPVPATGHDARLPRRPLPCAGGHRPAVGGDERGAGQQREQVVAAHVVVWEGEEAEHGASGHPLAQRKRGATVVGDAGGAQQLPAQAAVGLRRGVAEGDALERDAAPGGGHHVAQRRPHLVVGVGGGDDLHVGRQRGGVGWRRRHVDAETGDGGADPVVGRRVTGDAGDDVQRCALGQRREERAGADRQPLGEVHHDGAEGGDRQTTFVHGRGGGAHEVGLVVPLAGEPAGHVAVDADHVRRPLGGAGEGGRAPCRPRRAARDGR